MTASPRPVHSNPKKTLFHASPKERWVQYANSGMDRELGLVVWVISFHTAANCVGLLTISHIIGKSHPGGFQLGFFSQRYQSSSPGTVFGSNSCFVAALIPLSIIDPNVAEPKIISKSTPACKVRVTVVVKSFDVLILTAYFTRAYMRPVSTAADSATLANRAGVESEHAPPRHGVVVDIKDESGVSSVVTNRSV